MPFALCTNNITAGFETAFEMTLLHLKVCLESARLFALTIVVVKKKKKLAVKVSLSVACLVIVANFCLFFFSFSSLLKLFKSKMIDSLGLILLGDGVLGCFSI